MTELLVYFSVFVIMGGVLYILDEKYGVEKYNAWWKFTHKEPLPEGNLLGFICGRRTRDRVLPAAFVAGVVCFVLRYLGEHDFIALLLKGTFLMLPGLLIGFAIMGLIRKNPTFSPKVEAVLSVIDKVEDGKVDIGGMVRDVATEARELGGKVVDAVTGGDDGNTVPVQKSVSPSKSEETPSARPKGQSFSSALNDYKARE